MTRSVTMRFGFATNEVTVAPVVAFTRTSRRYVVLLFAEPKFPPM